ncbi:MAG: hypothetical protein ACLSE6_05920 [Alphaproteobacteria bacterium]
MVNNDLIEGNFGINEGQYHKDILTEEYKNWRNLDAEYIHFRFGAASKYGYVRMPPRFPLCWKPRRSSAYRPSAAIRLMLQFGLEMKRRKRRLLRLTYNDGTWSVEEICDDSE